MSEQHFNVHAHTVQITNTQYLCLSAVSLGVSLKALGIYADDGTRSSATPAHPKHKTGRVIEDDP